MTLGISMPRLIHPLLQPLEQKRIRTVFVHRGGIWESRGRRATEQLFNQIDRTIRCRFEGHLKRERVASLIARSRDQILAFSDFFRLCSFQEIHPQPDDLNLRFA
jgi:hypothetical protein